MEKERSQIRRRESARRDAIEDDDDDDVASDREKRGTRDDDDDDDVYARARVTPWDDDADVGRRANGCLGFRLRSIDRSVMDGFATTTTTTTDDS